MSDLQQNNVIVLDVNVSVDTEAPIVNLGGSKSLYYTMLKRMDEMSLVPNVCGLAQAVDNTDYDKMKQIFH